MGLFHSKVGHYLYTVKNVFFRTKTADTPHLIVQVEEGRLRGKDSVAAYSRKKYCSFLWVPYAAPPVGDLRFRPPQPRQPWEGTYDATYERYDCVQKDPFMYVIIGEEDCLYMNIYTPRPPASIIHPLPVMVFFHGGGFFFGSASRKLYGADFLIPEDVILCVPNYRLHVLGFLNLGIEECPGNVGMKDQVFALKWIQKNIRKFGGDENNVTIFGESAGGASVHYLMISPLPQGLFHKAIPMSGSALLSWTINHYPIEMAFRLGRIAGYRGNDRLELVNFLKKFSGAEIVQMFEEVMEIEADESPTRLNNFAPSIESIAEGAFLPDDPRKLVKLMKPIPTLWGLCGLEGMVLLKIWRRDVIDRAGKDFSIFIKNYFKMDREVVPIKSEEVRKLYFGDEPLTFSTYKQFIEFVTHLLFYAQYDSFKPLLNSKYPPYIYLFNYEGRLNFITQYLKVMNPQMGLFGNLKGACHGDDLFYMFYAKLLLLYPPLEKRDKKVIKFMCSMMGNFAKTGNPSTPEVDWKPATESNKQFLSIDSDRIEMGEGLPFGEKFDKFHELLDPVAEFW